MLTRGELRARLVALQLEVRMIGSLPREIEPEHRQLEDAIGLIVWEAREIGRELGLR